VPEKARAATSDHRATRATRPWPSLRPDRAVSTALVPAMTVMAADTPNAIQPATPALQVIEATTRNAAASWVFGGPWSYESSGRGEASGEDKAYLDEMTGANGAVIAGRGTYEAAGAWGGANPWDVPLAGDADGRRGPHPPGAGRGVR
jgi:hypothetical protein